MSSVIDLRAGQIIDNMKFGKIKSLNHIPVGNLVNGYKLIEELNNTLMVRMQKNFMNILLYYNGPFNLVQIQI